MSAVVTPAARQVFILFWISLFMVGVLFIEASFSSGHSRLRGLRS